MSPGSARDRRANERDRVADEREIDAEMRETLADERERMADARDTAQDQREARESDRERHADRTARKRDRVADERDRVADERSRAADQREIDAAMSADEPFFGDQGRFRTEERERVAEAREQREATLAATTAALRQQLVDLAHQVAIVEDGLAATFDRQAQSDVAHADELHAHAIAARRYAEHEREVARKYRDT